MSETILIIVVSFVDTKIPLYVLISRQNDQIYESQYQKPVGLSETR